MFEFILILFLVAYFIIALVVLYVRKRYSGYGVREDDIVLSASFWPFYLLLKLVEFPFVFVLDLAEKHKNQDYNRRR